jgi:hypothetical protein
MKGIAYAPRVMSTEPIRPLQDVWLRPRRVFRELADAPVGLVDQILGAAQGMVGWLSYCRAQDAGAKFSVGQIFGTALVVGSVVGIASLHAMAVIYARIGTRTTNAAPRRQVVHVLAYGGVPSAMSLGIWVLTALLAGEATFIQSPRADLEGFIAILLKAQFVSYVFLMVWSVVLQVMGFSEILGIATRKAFGVWVLGQLFGLLAALFLIVIIATLLPGT